MKFEKYSEKEKISCIYLIVYKITGQIYVGQTDNFYRRMNQHKNGAGIMSNSIIDIMIHELGINNFDVFILERVSKLKLKTREDYWIDILGADQGLNFNAYTKKERCIENRFISHSDVVNKIKKKYIIR